MKIHKEGREKVERYIGFGHYELIKGPVCDGAKGLWAGKRYMVTRLWKNVNCKRCLAKQVPNDK